jgi:hypothetical protein
LIRRAVPWLLWGTLACSGGTAARQAEVSSREGDEIVGVLHVSDHEAYVDHYGTRVRLIEAPPQTALSHTTLMTETAIHLKASNQERVQVRGNRQGSILWAAVVTPIRRNR